jgi:hypothetical protein
MMPFVVKHVEKIARIPYSFIIDDVETGCHVAE